MGAHDLIYIHPGPRTETSRWPSCLACFDFLWAGPASKRSRSAQPKAAVSVLDEATATELPTLEDACRVVRGCGCSLALVRRRCSVIAHLLPVSTCILVDNLRSRGPRNSLANTRRLRLALEALGPAFVKLGQAAASREDILSDEVAAELRKLCDQVAPFPDAEARRLVAAQLGDAAPVVLGLRVAAASLGQVYRLVKDGREYAMKVQRPGLNRALAMDVLILKGMAKFMRVLVRCFMAAPVDPVQIVDDWAQTLWSELDYRREGKSMEDMRAALCSRIKGLSIPRVSWGMTSLRVLTTEWVEGEKITEKPKCVGKTHISIGVEAFASMILNVGVVHADPHPGNMIIVSPTEVCLLDFGMVCYVPPLHRKAWARCIVDLVRQDHEAVLDDLVEIGFFPKDCPRDEILPVMSEIWRQLVECGSNIQKRKQAVQMLYSEILTFVRRFKFGLPDYYVALVRALVTLEGIALAADCNFDIFEAAFPCALRYLSESSATEKGALGSALLSAGLKNSGAMSKMLLKAASDAGLRRFSSRNAATLTSVVALTVSAAVLWQSANP